jgi:hypothetical protein
MESYLSVWILRSVEEKFEEPKKKTTSIMRQAKQNGRNHQLNKRNETERTQDVK